MRHHKATWSGIAAGMLYVIAPVSRAAPEAPPLPFAPENHAMAAAWHILPEPHNQESGYFSLCEAKPYCSGSSLGVSHHEH